MVYLRKHPCKCIQIKKSRKNNNLRDFNKANYYLFGININPEQPHDRPYFGAY